jgi:hypothetical protein
MKKSLALSQSTAISNDEETSNSHRLRKDARVKNVAKREELIKDNEDHIYIFVDEFLEESIKNSRTYETNEDVHYEFFDTKHNAHATLVPTLDRK